MTRATHAVLVAVLLTVLVLVERASAHHGAGRYDPRQKVEFQGKLTRDKGVHRFAADREKRIGRQRDFVARL